jgi:cephalosporin-C deacetylase-like acetyl esterase
LKKKGLNSIDPRCQITGITDRNEYQSFGFLPALDCLTVLGDVLNRFPMINKKKIIAYGSSYGGYIAMLCGKYAPNTFSVIIDNSGFSRAELKYIAGYETLLVDTQIVAPFEDEKYKFNLIF